MGRECAEDSTIDNVPFYTEDGFLKCFANIRFSWHHIFVHTCMYSRSLSLPEPVDIIV